MGGDEEGLYIVVGIGAQRAVVLVKVAPVVAGLIFVFKPVDCNELRGVGEECCIDLVTRIGVVFHVEVSNAVLKFGGTYGAVVDENKNVVLLVGSVAINLGLGRELVVGRLGICRRALGRGCHIDSFVVLSCWFLVFGDIFGVEIGGVVTEEVQLCECNRMYGIVVGCGVDK